MKTTRYSITAMVGGLAALMAVALPAHADFPSPSSSAITKTVVSGTSNPLAGSPISYLIQVHPDWCGKCSISGTPCVTTAADCTGAGNVCVSTPATNVEVHDQLPVDAFNNPEVAVVSTDCSSNAPGATIPACLGGQATQDASGLLTWTFPGNSCSAVNSCQGGVCTVTGGACVPGGCPAVPRDTLTTHLNVTLNPNLTDGTSVCNQAKAEDDALKSVPISAPACVTVDSANLSVTKRAFNMAGTLLTPGGNVDPGTMVTYTLDVTNSGDASANGLVISDVVPAGMTYVPGSAQACVGPACDATNVTKGTWVTGFPDTCTTCGSFNSPIVQWQYNTLPGGAPIAAGTCAVGACTNGSPGTGGGACTVDANCIPEAAHKIVRFTATVNSTDGTGSVLFNIATAIDASGHMGMGTHTLVVDGACLTITKTPTTCVQPTCAGSTTCNPLIPAANDQVTYAIVVSNGSGPGCTAASGVTVTDTLPSGETFNTCTGGASCGLSGANVVWSVGTLATGASAPLTATVKINPGQQNGTSLPNVATAKSNNGGLATANSTITVQNPVLSVTKIASPSPVEPGGTISYSFIVANSGQNCASAVTVLDNLPANADYTSGSETFSGCGTTSTSTLIFAADLSKFLTPAFDLAPGQVCNGNYKEFVPEKTQLNQTIKNTVTATDSLGDTSSATATDTVNTRILGLSKTLSGCSLNGVPCSNLNNVPLNAILDYTLTVSSGPYLATGVVVTDGLPPTAVASFNSTTCPSYSLVATQLTCNLGTIAANTTASFSVKVKVNGTNSPGTVITNTAMVTDDAMDMLGVSNSVTDAVDTTVAAPDPTPDPSPSAVASPTASPSPSPTPKPGRTRRPRRTPKPRATRKPRG